VIAAMGMAGRMTQRWEDANTQLLAEQRKASDVAGGFGAVSKVLRMLLQSAMLGIGAWLVIAEESTAVIMPVDPVAARWRPSTSPSPTGRASPARQGWRRLKKVLETIRNRANARLYRRPPRRCKPSQPARAQRLLVQDITFGMKRGALAVLDERLRQIVTGARAGRRLAATCRGVRLDGRLIMAPETQPALACRRTERSPVRLPKTSRFSGC
jgi:ATP-binding cassette subfamily C protein